MNIILFVVISVILNLSASNAQDKVSVHNKLIEKYGNINSLQAQFEILEIPELSGTIKAVKGNKFVIEIKDRVLTSNGKTIWNYSKKNKQLIISDFDESQSDFSIDQLFFSLILAYSPKELKSSSSSDGKSDYLLTLEPEKASDQIASIKKIIIKFNPATLLINFMTVDSESGVQRWKISNLNLNPKFPDKLFSYTIPKDSQIEVVDLRN